MTDLETPEQFVWTLTAGAEDVGQVDVAHLLTEDDVASWLSAAIRARDAAVRREALREAADWLARCVPDEATERNEWQQVLADAADSLCAIADWAPKSPADVTIPTLATGDADD